MINVSERPAEADDRAVPGHWEGDLIIGTRNLSAIGTLVERTTNYTMLLHLPDGYTPEQVRDALIAKIKTLPEVLRASLTWDQGPEMVQVETSRHRSRYRHLLLRPARTLATGHERKHQRPTAAILSEEQRPLIHTAADLDWVAAELNDRPRKRLGFKKPIEEIGPLLLR